MIVCVVCTHARGGVERVLLEQQPARAEALPHLVAVVADEQVAVRRLDHQPPARAQHAPDLGQHPHVLVVAEVAERGEEVDRGVEGLVPVRQLAVVGRHELGPRPLVARAPPRLREQRLGAVDADDAVAGARERHGVAPEAARDVEDVAAVGAAGEPDRRERLRLGVALALVLRVGAQVEVAEELVPGLRRAGRAPLHGVSRRGTAGAAGCP